MPTTLDRLRAKPVAVLLAAVLTPALLATGLTGCQSNKGRKAATSIPSPTITPDLEYVALGDSYTAAPGVPNTDLAGGCIRSDNNYPSLLARRQPRLKLIDRSCSGAKTEALMYPQWIYGQRIEPQMDALTVNTDLVTMSIGANDNDMFTIWASYCTGLYEGGDREGSPCRDTPGPQGGLVTLNGLAALTDRITGLVNEARRRAPNAQVVLVGYPQIIPELGTCPDRLPLATGDYSYAFDLNAGFNDAVADAATRTNTPFVDIWTLSAGHDVCSEDPWEAGKDNEPGAMRFHPFRAEQEAVADALHDLVESSGLTDAPVQSASQSPSQSPSPGLSP